MQGELNSCHVHASCRQGDSVALKATQGAPEHGCRQGMDTEQKSLARGARSVGLSCACMTLLEEGQSLGGPHTSQKMFQTLKSLLKGSFK